MTSPVKLVGKMRFKASTGHLDSANWPGNEAGHFLPYSSPSIWMLYISKVTHDEKWVVKMLKKQMLVCKPFLYQTAVIFPLKNMMTLYQIVKS